MAGNYAKALRRRLSDKGHGWLVLGLVCGGVAGVGLAFLLHYALTERPLNEMIETLNRTAPLAIMEGVKLDRLEWRDENLNAHETVALPPEEMERLAFEIQRFSAPAWCTGKGLLPRILRAAGKITVVDHDEQGTVVMIGFMQFDGCDELLHRGPTID